METLGQESRSYDVRSAYPADTAIASGLYLIGWSSVAYLHIIGRYQPWLSNDALMVMFGVILVSIVVGALSVWQMLRPSYALRIDSDVLTLRKKQLKASRIKRIYVSKDDNPSIAFKPHGAWLVPNDYSIKFAEDREGERQRWELLLWAEEHDVPIVRGKAIRWL